MRIVSMAAVVLLHAASQYWRTTSVTTLDWNAMNFYDGIVRWAVPVFVMISGVLFLDPIRQESIRKLWTKNIPRIVVIILIWGLIYAVLYSPPQEMTFEGLWAFCKVWVLGHYHMWFLFMILGLYAVTPILRCVTRDKAAARYFLGAAFVVCILLPFVTSFGHLSILSSLAGKMELQVVGGYAFYYVLGYWLNSTELSRKQRGWLIAGGMVGLALTILLTAVFSIDAGKPQDIYYGNFSLPVCMAAVGVFAALGFVKLQSAKSKSVVRILSGASLGVYLVHVIVLDALRHIGFDSVMFSSAFAIPVVAAITILVSFGIAVVLKKIPVAGKWIV